MTRAQRWAIAGAAVSFAGAALAAVNSRTARLVQPPGHVAGRYPAVETVCVCIPARDEAASLPRLLDDLRAYRGPHRLRVIVVDDGSSDRTAEVARGRVAGDHRFRIETAPTGVTGKTAACRWGAHLSDRSDRSDLAEKVAPTVLVFVDADVRLGADALDAAVGELRSSEVAMLCPWPAQQFIEPVGALLQPLLAWSWSTTLPVRLSERFGLPSMAVACGQFLVFDAARYRQIGGHAAAGTAVAEDLALARAMRRAGGRTAVRYAPELARCTMYRSTTAVRAGHRRWLAPSAAGPIGAAAVTAHLALTGLIPLFVLTVGGRLDVRLLGAAGYASTVVGRLLVRRAETGVRPNLAEVISALAHPVAAATEIALLVDSARAHRRGDVEWKGRRLGR